ncbi:hypothetical protein IAT38_004308 [Cryptococcus sp. DSM 104549]
MAVFTFKFMAGCRYRLAGSESLRRMTFTDLEQAAAAARRAYEHDPHNTSFLPDETLVQVYPLIAALDSELSPALYFLHDPFLSPDEQAEARDIVTRYQTLSVEDLEEYLVDPEEVRLTQYAPEVFARWGKDEEERRRVVQC